MAQLARHYYSPEEYLRLEEADGEKHEYLHGQIYAMAGASEAHNLITGNVLAELNIGLRGKDCRTYGSDMRVEVEVRNYYTYPDVSVICGKPQFYNNRKDTITNPILIVEVLSPSTEKYDRSEKFELYRALPSFVGYLLIDQSRVYVEYHQKIGPNRWVLETIGELGGILKLSEVGLEIPLANVYDKVEFNSL